MTVRETLSAGVATVAGGGPITAAKVDEEAFDPKAIAFANLAQTARDAIAKMQF
jgi:hypothetical protein